MDECAATKYSLVQFVDGKQKTKLLVLSKTIKGFNPKSPEDLTDKEYQVKWQDSFCDNDAGIDDDGCYPAKILIVGATPDEIRAKAKELRILLPMTFPPPESEFKEHNKKKMKKVLRKTRTRGEDDTAFMAQKKRMMETNLLLDQSVSAENSSKKSISLTNTTIPSKDLPAMKRKSTSNSRDKGTELVTKSRHQNGRSKRLCASQQGDSTSSRANTSSRSNEHRRALSEGTHQNGDESLKMSPSVKGHHDNQKDSPFPVRRISLKGNSDKSSHSSNRHQEHKKGSALVEVSLHGSKHEHRSFSESDKMMSGDLGSPAMDCRSLGLSKSHSPSVKEHLFSEEKTLEKYPLKQVVASEDTFETESVNASKENVFGSADTDLDSSQTCESSNSSSGSNSGNDENDDDDATVLLDNLKKEHMFCSFKIEELEDKNKRLLQNLKSTKNELSKNKLDLSDLKAEVETLQAENSVLKMRLLGKGGGDERSPHCKSSTSSHQQFSSASKASPWIIDSSPSSLAILNSSSKSSPVSTKGNDSSKSSPTTSKSPNSIRKKLFSDNSHELVSPTEHVKRTSKKSKDDEFPDGLEGIAQRIKADLTGKKPLSGDEKRVNVGMGLQIGRKAWEKNLRLRKEDSRFLKDCAGHIWGRDALKLRTGNRKTADKKPCTPKKVDLLHAMLKGKMMARGESDTQQKFILENFAPKWLTDKCYDSGRPPKGKKSDN